MDVGKRLKLQNSAGIKEFILENRGIMDHGDIEEIEYRKTSYAQVKLP